MHRQGVSVVCKLDPREVALNAMKSETITYGGVEAHTAPLN